jgi:hypothetical protein
MTCVQGKKRGFDEFEESIVSRKRKYEFCAKKVAEKLVYDVTEH